ncbi:hypothetical protein ABEH50_004028 [Yersinia enterocolitica]
MSEIKQYDTEVRLEAVMGTNHYGVHIHAMTAENLHSKSDIAVELAWRDLRIEQLIAQLEAAQKEIHDLKMKLSDAGCLLVEWKHRVEKAEKELGDLLNQEFQQRLANAEHQLYMKDLAIHNIKASRKAQFRKRLAAEAALSAANEKLKGEQVPIFLKQTGIGVNSCQGSYKEYVTIEESEYEENPTKHLKLFTAPQKPVVLPEYKFCPAEYQGSLLWSETEVWNKAIDAAKAAIKAAGGKVEGE